MSHVVILIILLAVITWPSSPGVAGVTRPEAVTVADVGAKININTADAKELMKLQGVSRSLAEKIVQYRDAHGPFKKAPDLRKVDGVGDGVWEKNRQRIVVK